MLRGYGKVDEVEDLAYRRKTRKRMIIIAVSSVLLFVAVIGIVAGSLEHKHEDNNTTAASQMNPSTSLKAVCSVTQYPDSCFTSISKMETSNVTDPEELFKLSLLVAINELANLANFTNQLANNVNNTADQAALTVCGDVIEDAIDNLNDSISAMSPNDGGDSTILSTGKVEDIGMWLSTVITDQETCLDALEEANSTLVEDVRAAMSNSMQYSSNSLAIVTKILNLLSEFKVPIHRRLLQEEEDFPSWLSAGDRRLLQQTNPIPNVIVAKDKSGNFTKIKDAIAAVPDKNETRFVIYVKAGTYNETVVVPKTKWNVMMYGDGKMKTIVTGSLNFVDGTPTYSTATFAAQGKGFIGRDMRFKNTAGPQKHQAVAFRLESDQSLMYRCAFDAYQDTLYTYSNRQFFRDCDVLGTIDFIFGNAAVVFQNCSIKPRQPLSFQFNTVTAQGKSDPNQQTGISIQKCNLSANGVITVPSYLGRPWKNYSTTVVMQSKISGFLNPKGWTEWIPNQTPPNTIFYAEYRNSGPGSSTANRVKWPGYKPALTSDQAGKFTVNSFIQGSTWLPQTGVPFFPSL